MYEQPLHMQRNISTSGLNATHVFQGYLSRNTTHTVLPKLTAWPWSNSNSPAEYCRPQKKGFQRDLLYFFTQRLEEAQQSANFMGVDSHKSAGLRLSFYT